MSAVPAGEFLMGSDDPEADADERPAAPVHLDAFRIDRVEVTNARYGACVEAGACLLPAGAAFGAATKADHPVALVGWTQAAAYCRWVGKRLPTEAEWEKAARGVDGRRYAWGSRFEPDRVNAGYTAGTAAVGSYAGGASPYGVLDMAGNVWEWTSSLYRPYPYDPGDGREDPTARGARVNRGGSWYYGAWYARTTYRATADHMYRRIADLGFRCARSGAVGGPAASAAVIEAGREDDPAPGEAILDPAGEASRRLLAPHEAVHRRAPGGLAGPRRAPGQELVDEFGYQGVGETLALHRPEHLADQPLHIGEARAKCRQILFDERGEDDHQDQVRDTSNQLGGWRGEVAKSVFLGRAAQPRRGIGNRQDATPVGRHGATEQERRRPIARDATTPFEEEAAMLERPGPDGGALGTPRGLRQARRVEGPIKKRGECAGGGEGELRP
jgi:hypothetical protein